VTFTAKEVSWSAEGDALSSVRHAVFVEEQEIDPDEEWDGEDPGSRHFLARDEGGRPIGTARLMPSGQIGRMAVLAEWRGHGVGARLLALAVEAARQGAMERIFLHAQAQVVEFYERAGFEAFGEPFFEAGIEHRMMALGG